MKQFIDSSVIVLAFTPNERAIVCQTVLQKGGIINGLALIESFEAIRRITQSREQAWRAIRSLQNSNLEIVNITNGLIFEALKMSGKYNLKVFDLIHYTTALLNGCSAIVSYDRHFDGLEIKRVEP